MSSENDMVCRPVLGRPRWLAGVALHAAILGACSFAPEGPGLGPPPDGPPQPPTDTMVVDTMGPPIDTMDPIDTAPPDARPAPRDVVHVPEDRWEGNTADATWTGDVTIDTQDRRITGPGTDGLEVIDVPQDPSGPGLAVLHVGNLTVNADVEVRVTGDRPLVIISSGSITLNGVIDAGGRGQEPGAGGAGPEDGTGQGGDGVHRGESLDSGGSGAGYGTDGAIGGPGCADSNCDVEDSAVGPAGGTAYGSPELDTLAGGSGGGRGGEGGGSCDGGDGGAGGGAVQLYALNTITIGASGGISVGGGGGRGGLALAGAFGCAASAGGGGGSGGAVYLQAQRIELSGTLAANGGGGGAGATGGGGDNRAESGGNGALSGDPAVGGPDDTDGGNAGGNGGAGTTAPTSGAEGDANGGGGGGAVGRIVLNCTDFEGSGLISPDAFRTAGCQ